MHRVAMIQINKLLFAVVSIQSLKFLFWQFLTFVLLQFFSPDQMINPMNGLNLYIEMKFDNGQLLPNALSLREQEK